MGEPGAEKTEGPCDNGLPDCAQMVKIPSNQFVPTASTTRGHMRFHRIYNKTNYYKYSFFPSVIKLWNALPSSVVSAPTLEDFKEKLADVHLKPP